MNSLKTLLIFSVVMIAGLVANAQVTQINLEQVKGDFTTKTLELSEGDYMFNISNNNVGKDVGFVLVPQGQYDQSQHIQAAYVKSAVPNNGSSMTGVVDLEPGTYEYFCPMNSTPKYTLTVHEEVETVRLNQVEGKFIENKLMVKEGKVQFEVANVDVDRQVGFVLVPQGKYDAADHIKAAYVTAPVEEGSSSRTGIVDLKAGTYEYFCPLNPTPKYTLTVVE